MISSYFFAPIGPRNETELRLSRIWEEVLSIHPISVTADFFALGGHSLIAIKLLSHIQRVFGRRIRLAMLFENPTIARLAQQLQKDEPLRTFQHLVPIQPKGDLPPLYLLPGAGGHVLYFHALATRLGQEQPVYGLEAPGLHGQEKIPSSVEEHAALLLTELRKKQPQGPYRLAGHSAGGLVAFALAQQLEREGESVEELIILDSPLL